MIIKNNKTISSVYKGSKVIDKIYKGTLVVYESWKNLIASGVPPLTLLNCKGVDLVDYKLYGNSVQGILPSEYQQVDYIENKGYQYIDTGVLPNNNTGIDITYKSLNYTVSQYIAGSRSYNSTVVYAINGSNSRTDWDIRFNGSAIFSNVARTDNKFQTKISLNNGTGTWNLTNLDTGESSSIEISNQSVTATTNLFLFAYNNVYVHNNLRIYSCKIYDGQTLIRHFIPCYRKSDDVIGMYDLVNEIFYENAGTGAFLKGNNAPKQEAPIEVESVGDKTKNLFDNVWKKGTYLMTTGAYTNSANRICSSNFINVKPNTDYTISFNTTVDIGSVMRILFYDKDGIFISSLSNTQTFTTPENCEKLHFYLATDYSIDAAPTGQIEENTEATDYEPYGYKIPVKTRGKNLLDLENMQVINVLATTVRGGWEFTFKKATTITITYGDAETLESGILMAKKVKNGVYGNTIQLYTNKTTISVEQDEKLLVFVGSPSVSNSHIMLEKNNITWIMLEENNEATEYEPYIEPITTNIYLNEPLRRVGDYADYIDFEQGKVIRKVGVRTFDGTEEWVLHTTTYSEDGVFRNENLLTPLIGAPISSTFMTHFALTYNGSTSSWEAGLYRFTYSSNNIAGSRVYISAKQTTVDEFKEWLTINKPSIYYPLTKEITEIIQLPNIPTLKGTTILSVDATIQPSNMEVVYKGKEVK